jgi:hypothetical protein
MANPSPTLSLNPILRTSSKLVKPHDPHLPRLRPVPGMPRLHRKSSSGPRPHLRFQLPSPLAGHHRNHRLCPRSTRTPALNLAKTMNLTPAETWLKKAFTGNPVLLEQLQIREPSLKFYRQIQADALRFAASRLSDGYGSGYQMKALVEEILNQANQLHPLPEPKDHP